MKTNPKTNPKDPSSEENFHRSNVKVRYMETENSPWRKGTLRVKQSSHGMINGIMNFQGFLGVEAKYDLVEFTMENIYDDEKWGCIHSKDYVIHSYFYSIEIDMRGLENYYVKLSKYNPPYHFEHIKILGGTNLLAFQVENDLSLKSLDIKETELKLINCSLCTLLKDLKVPDTVEALAFHRTSVNSLNIHPNIKFMECNNTVTLNGMEHIMNDNASKLFMVE